MKCVLKSARGAHNWDKGKALPNVGAGGTYSYRRSRACEAVV
jgi:hypothetical protein